MNNKPTNPKESLWRRQLSEAERAGLRGQPELELEARLTDALSRIPDTPVPSNFTARTLNTIDIEATRSMRKGWNWNWRSLLPRMAVATAILVFAGISIHRYETRSHRIQLAKNVALVAAAQPPPSVDVLENLDVIQHMGASNHADSDLLAALR